MRQNYDEKFSNKFTNFLFVKNISWKPDFNEYWYMPSDFDKLKLMNKTMLTLLLISKHRKKSKINFVKVSLIKCVTFNIIKYFAHGLRTDLKKNIKSCKKYVFYKIFENKCSHHFNVSEDYTEVSEDDTEVDEDANEEVIESEDVDQNELLVDSIDFDALEQEAEELGNKIINHK